MQLGGAGRARLVSYWLAGVSMQSMTGSDSRPALSRAATCTQVRGGVGFSVAWWAPVSCRPCGV